MQKIVYIFFLINLLNLLNKLVNTMNNVYNNRLRNFGLRIIVFKEKKLVKILKEINKLKQIYYNKAIICTFDGINSYNELSDDDKTIIETIISLCY